MQNKNLRATVGNTMGIISLVIPTVILILILNWFLKITPYQKLQGLPLMITPFICPIVIILSIISRITSVNKFWKTSVVINVILILLPFLYWSLGTLVFGV